VNETPREQRLEQHPRQCPGRRPDGRTVPGGRPAPPWRLRALVGTAAAALFCALAVAVAVRGGAPFGLDGHLHHWAVHHRGTPVRQIAVGITATGSGPIAYLLAAGAGALGRRGWRPVLLGAATGLAVLLAAQLTRSGVAVLIDRPRPPSADWAHHASGAAFPSGHTTTSATIAGLYVTAAYYRLEGAWRRAVPALAVFWACCVGLTRIVLGVHWPTDVAGGWLLATAWTALAAPLARPLPPAGSAPVGSRALPGRGAAGPADLQGDGDERDHDDESDDR
jgi:membrane-associated phospholipid phosphatase